jgi:Protein of unknown function DUF262
MAQSRRHNQQTIAWFNDLRKRNLLDLDPPYQRRSVWNQAYKDAFIDTLLLQYPSPAIFLYQEISADGQTSMHVVDGKQRLTTVFEFVDGRYPVSEEAQLTALRGLYFAQLPSDIKTDLWTYEFTVEYLPTNEEGLINSIFERINKNVAKLTRQELRHARYNGKFISAAEQLTDWMAKVLPENFPRFESQSRKQMKDVELVANLLLLIEDGAAGYSQDDLDKAFSDRDLNWDEEENVVATFRDIVQRLKNLCDVPTDPTLVKTRLRNQADFYSLFGALREAYSAASAVVDAPDGLLVSRLLQFVLRVDDPDLPPGEAIEARYLNAARSNSNDKGQREQRIKIIGSVLEG